MKTILSNPELGKTGQKCKVLINSKWIGAQTNDHNCYVPAVIKEVKYLDKEFNDKYYNIPTVTVNVRTSPKLHNGSVENLMILPSEIGKHYQSHMNEWMYEDYKTIIFK